MRDLVKLKQDAINGEGQEIMENKIFVNKLGPLYLTSDPVNPWTSDPVEAVRMTFDTAQTTKETDYIDIAVHPLEQVNYTVDFGEGQTFSTQDLASALKTAISKASETLNFLEFTIQVADVFLNQDGFSKKAKAWKM